MQAIDLKTFNKFIKGKSYTDNTNVYIFRNDNNDQLHISELIENFKDNKSASNYLKYQVISSESNILDSGIIPRRNVTNNKITDEYDEVRCVQDIIENYCKSVAFCQGCGTIVLSSQITNTKADKCEYCDMYICKICKKKHPKIEMQDGICDSCRNKGA